MSVNLPEGPKKIINYPKNQSSNNLLTEITMESVYKEARTFRIQVLILIEFSRTYYDGIFKFTYKDVADMFDVSVPIIKRAYFNGKKDIEEITKPNGRPFGVSKNQMMQFIEWYNSQKEPPKFDAVKSFIANLVGTDLDYRAYKNALEKVDLKIEEAESIEDKRYYCPGNSIDYYYAMIGLYFLTYDIPSYFVFNVDEEGHDEYVDTKKKELLVVPKSNTEKLLFPVERKDDHTTFVACIAADGSYLKPLIVVKRKTIEARALRKSLSDKVMILCEDTGYINSEIFNKWLSDLFIPEVQERRRKFNYTGPAVLILDGCPSHYTNDLYDLCNKNNIKIFFIPPHSSNQTQMLDLATFHSHKENVRKARILDIDNDDLLIDKIIMLYDSFHRSASYSNIISSFETAGVVYDVSESDHRPIVRMSIDHTTRLWNHPRTKEQKAQIREDRKGKSETELRVKLEDFNSFVEPYWKNDRVTKVISKMPKIINYVSEEDKDPLHKLMIASVPLNIDDIKVLNEKKEI